MSRIRVFIIAVLAAITLASCNRDPEVAKRGYLDSGNKYFAKGRYSEARIQYQRALKTDPKFGDAHYRLALTLMQIQPPNWASVVRSFRRAVELTKESDASHWDSMVKVSEIYLSSLARHDDQLIAEVDNYVQALLKHDPNSPDAHRLLGVRHYVVAREYLRQGRKDDAGEPLDKAVEELQRADALKPNDRGVNAQLAVCYALKGDLAESERRYRAVIALDKTFLEAYRELYVLLWSQKKADEAEQVLRQGYQNNPKEHTFLVWLAGQYMTQGRREDMLRSLDTLKTKISEHERALLDVGDFYSRTGDAESAIREYREGMTKDAKNKSVYQTRIVEVLLRQGKQAEAAEMNAQILKDSPNDMDARSRAGAMLLDRGDVQKAIDELQSVVAHAPNNPVAQFNLGRALFMRGQAGQARQHFQRALDLNQGYNAARLALAQVQTIMGEYDGALRSVNDALQAEPNNAPAKLIQSAALLGQKKYSESRAVLDAMLKANPSSADALFQSGVVNLSEGRYAEAEAAFKKSYQLNPTATRGLLGIVESYMTQKKPDEAIKLLQAEAAKNGDRPDFHLALANVAVRASRWDLAITEFQTVLNVSKDNSKLQGEMYLRIGETYRRKGDLANAIQALQNARKTLSEDARVLSVLALSLDTAGRWNEARPIYEAVVRIDSSNGIVLNNLAFGLAEHGGDLDQALTLAQRARQLIPATNEVSDTLGWIYLKKNLTPQAVDVFRELVQRAPQQSTFRYHYGMALFQLGDRPRAVVELKKALESNPGPDERRKIQDLIARAG